MRGREAFYHPTERSKGVNINSPTPLFLHPFPNFPLISYRCPALNYLFEVPGLGSVKAFRCGCV